MNYRKRVKIMLTKREDRNIEEQENRKMKIERESAWEREKGIVNGRTAVTKLYNEATVFWNKPVLYSFVQAQTDAVWAVPLLQYGRNVAR